MATDVDEFIKVMTPGASVSCSRQSCRSSARPKRELRAIKAPACLIAGNDVIHTPATARKAAALIPNSELHETWSQNAPTTIC